MIYYYKAQPVDINGSILLRKWTAFTTLIGSSFCENFQLITLHSSDTHARSEEQNGCDDFIKTGNDIKALRNEASDDKIPPVIFLKSSGIFCDRENGECIRTLALNFLSLTIHIFDKEVADLSNCVRCGHLIVCLNCNSRCGPEPTDLIQPSHVSTAKEKTIGTIVYLPTSTNVEAKPDDTIIQNKLISITNKAECLTNRVDLLGVLEYLGLKIIKEIYKNLTKQDFMVGATTKAFLRPDAFNIAPTKENAKVHSPTIIEQSEKTTLAAIFDKPSKLFNVESRNGYLVVLNVTFPVDCSILSLLKEYGLQIDFMKKLPIDFTAIDSCRTAKPTITNIITNEFFGEKVRMYNYMKVWTSLIAIVNSVTLKNTHHSTIEKYNMQIVQRYYEYSSSVTSEIETSVPRTKPEGRSACVLSKGHRLNLFRVIALYLATFVLLAVFCNTL